MNVVGRVGSLISQGVYSVATPFHPFGGAVDIIVVEQEDGTYRSTPWYVCFGKFQGVLKVAEKIVAISVNGVGANFHMFLDNSGKAYFMREVMSGSDEAESSGQVLDESETLEMSQSGEIDGGADDHHSVYSEIKEEVENDGHSYGFLDEQSPPKCSAVSSGFSTYHYGSLNEVEDLVKSSDDSNLEMVLVSIDGHVLTAPILSDEANTDNVQLSNPQFHLGPGEGSSEEFGASGDVWEVGDFGDLDASISKDMDASGNQSKDLKDGGEVTVYVQENHGNGNSNMGSSLENLRAGISKDEMFKSCLDLTSHIDGADSPILGSPSIVNHSPTMPDRNIQIDASEPVSIGMKDLATNPCVDSRCKDDQVSVSETLRSCDLPCCASSPEKNIETEASEEKPLTIENTLNTGSGGCSPHSSTNDHEQMVSVPGRSAAEEECCQTDIPALQRSISGLGFEISLCGNLLQSGIGRDSAEEAFEAHRISEDEFKESGSSIIKNENLIVRFAGRYFPWDKAAHIILGKAVFGSHFSIEPKDSIPVEHEVMVKAREDPNRISPSNSRRWRLWSIPFRRGKSLQRSDSDSSNKELFVDSESAFQNPDAEPTSNGKNTQSPRKQFLRTNIPTTEQIASLNLKEGQNMIAFSFSTRVLGKQQVDAHVYLWKWNAKIVISDVDGTITKSDVLGQFMPLVGKDWTQSGVARFFSAIKENGYQLLFLSARAIVQAYLTRSFLLNLKQDGKALPSGPVVISPDGLFPSLYREVVRRAPHEFKIACLEDIRALFPSDYNPFYAGFGNRDTDELSYRKIGIPKGKIFIINPKGEVAINHCIDVKSYTSLHTLVNDMFPSTSLVEQEDFNSWNYWKTPLPNIDC